MITNTGAQVPVSVVIFGIAGGYLRFLYYTATEERRPERRRRREPTAVGATGSPVRGG